MIKKDLSEVTLFGTGVFGRSKEELLRMLSNKVLSGDLEGLYWINTPNAEQIVLASGDDVFRCTLNMSNIRIPDGVSLVWSSKILKISGKISNSISERISGVDLVDDICRLAEVKHKGVYLLGGMGAVAEFAAQKLKTKYPKLKIEYSAGTDNIKNLNEKENEGMLEKIKQSGASVLFVGYGAPWQEAWVDRNKDGLESMGLKLVMVVGGAYDMISGNITRAPEVMRKIGLEWLWRLAQQPWRWRRQLSLFRYWGMVGKSVLGIRH